VPSHRDIAARLGLSKSAVSLALTGSPKVSEATRRKVLRIARQLGYVADARTSAYMAHIRRGKPRADRPIIAVVSRFPRRGERARNPYYRAFWERVAARAEELGFQAEEFEVIADGIPAERLGKILLTRRIEALILAPSGRPVDPLPRDCSSLAIVQATPGGLRRAFHHVRPDHFANVLLATRKMASLGYDPLALVWVGDELPACRTEIAAAWTLSARARSAAWPEPIFQKDYDLDEIQKKLRQIQPRGVLSNWPGVSALCGGCQPYFIGFAAIGLPPGNSALAGVDRNDAELDRECVDMVAAQWLAGDRGVPRTAKSVRHIGFWRDGPSAPPITGAASASRKL